MRETLVEGRTLGSLYENGALIGLSIHSLLYLLVGMGILVGGYWRAREKGTLGHY